MIEVKNLETGLTFSDYIQGILPNVPTWMICTKPSMEELKAIQNTYKIPWEDLEDSLDVDERPRLELSPENDPPFIKLVLRVPSGEQFKKTDLFQSRQTTLPATVFLTGSHLITIQYQAIEAKRVRKPIGSRRKRSKPTILVLLDWLESVVKSYELGVDIIDQELASLEQVIFKSVKSKSIEQVFTLSREATYLDAALRGNVRAFYQLQKAPEFKELPELLDDLEDLSIDLQQQADLLRIYRDLIESSLDAYASVISNNQNDLIRVLTSISLIVMVPTLIASLYGMNLTPLPLSDNPYSFWIVIFISFVLIVPIWYVLHKIELI
ncbi:MAG: magnesium transporter CorA family protein [Candidatus Hodarchaeales archaeon]